MQFVIAVLYHTVSPSVYNVFHLTWVKVDLHSTPLDLEGLKNEMNESACVFDLYDIYPIEKLKSSGFKIFKLGVYSDLLN